MELKQKKKLCIYIYYSLLEKEGEIINHLDTKFGKCTKKNLVVTYDVFSVIFYSSASVDSTSCLISFI